MKSIKLLKGNIVPLLSGNTVSTLKTNIEELIMLGALIITGGVLLHLLSKRKKIQALGFFIFAGFIIAVLGDVSILGKWVKAIFTYFTGNAW